MSIEQKQQEIIDEFTFFDEWQNKYEYLIELAKHMPLINEDKKTDEYIIEGCQSRVWVDFETKEGKIFFSADADALTPKGVIALLIKILNGETPENILKADIYNFLATIQLQEHLSPTRSNGLLNMVKQLKRYALWAQAQQIELK